MACLIQYKYNLNELVEKHQSRKSLILIKLADIEIRESHYLEFENGRLTIYISRRGRQKRNIFTCHIMHTRCV